MVKGDNAQFQSPTHIPSIARMLYHALRLACITISSFKTWEAVVNSTDRSQARRHLFLWFLTLAGLSIEPIVDSLLSHQVPMYESFKIIIAGWLLLAHFYLSKPIDDIAPIQSWQEEKHLSKYENNRISSPVNREYESLRLRRPQQGQKHITQHEERGTTLAATNLDFGRFKRDLERRQSSKSISTSNDYISPSQLISKQRPLSIDRNSTISASVLSNPFKASSNTPPDITRTLESPRSTSRISNRAPSPYLDGKSPSVAYEFGVEPISRKRPLAATMFDSRSTKSVPKHTSRAQLAETKRRNKGPRSQPSLDPAKTETSSSRMTKRLRQLAEDELVDNLERYDNQDQAKTPDRSTAQDNPRKGEIQPIKSFARPKPPGKNRAALVSQPSLLNKSRKSPLQGQDSRGTEQNTSTPLAGSQAEPETGLVSASLESRMDHVRDWLKERNPPMISPPLSLRSDDLRESRMPHKRKAYRQLAPPTGSKRLAMEGSRDRQRRDEDSRIYPQLSDTVASASQTQSQPLSRKSNALLSPRHDRQRTVIGTSKEIDPLRDQAEADLSPPPINWSKFQRPKTVARTSSSSSATAVAFPSSSFTFRKTPTKSNSFIAKALDAEDEDNPTVSPLIKLRQSQLKQRQHEDYLGIKRDDAMNRRAEAEGALAFNQALETWEREDDEALARNAAREAAEAEARGQRPGISQDDSPSSLSSDPEEKRRRTSPSLMDKEYSSSTNSAPARSLLRAVPFNGESSRRPVPDFQSKRSLSDTPTQQRTVSDPGADAAPSSIPSRRPASPLDQRPLSTKSFSSSFDNGNSHTRGSASLTKRISYSNTRKEDTANRRERHPGLYTPSKKKPIPDAVSILNKQPHTPTVMSRYIQLSNLSDEEELYE